MKHVDRLLYRFGIVRRSVFNELREAAEQMQTEWFDYQKRVEHFMAYETAGTPKPKPPKFKLIQGGKND